MVENNSLESADKKIQVQKMPKTDLSGGSIWPFFRFERFLRFSKARITTARQGTKLKLGRIVVLTILSMSKKFQGHRTHGAGVTAPPFST